jgi:hypothetical protein
MQIICLRVSSSKILVPDLIEYEFMIAIRRFHWNYLCYEFDGNVVRHKKILGKL